MGRVSRVIAVLVEDIVGPDTPIERIESFDEWLWRGDDAPVVTRTEVEQAIAGVFNHAERTGRYNGMLLGFVIGVVGTVVIAVGFGVAGIVAWVS